MNFFINKVSVLKIQDSHNDLLTKLLYVEIRDGLVNLGNNELKHLFEIMRKKMIYAVELTQRNIGSFVKLMKFFDDN